MEQSLPQLILPIKLERSLERLTSLCSRWFGCCRREAVGWRRSASLAPGWEVDRREENKEADRNG